ncbi:hypothetical protein T11_15563 [Trichinella zimbabwensis]|uniref:HAT C-terminal dimerisation domain-containing protein n=1 Tax=Trichinella zimbabwensis TaxID=268475 RepID=A0A0V1H6A3_9BILA|nr:hypothetical protein T11_15563 [Trichinella zimbabwensis]
MENSCGYLNLRELARNIPVLLGSTCMCEAAFSRMKYLKHKYRTRLVNDNLEAGIRLMVSNEKSDFARLVEMVPESKWRFNAVSMSPQFRDVSQKTVDTSSAISHFCSPMAPVWYTTSGGKYLVFPGVCEITTSSAHLLSSRLWIP